jgi:hypothetical protein
MRMSGRIGMKDLYLLFFVGWIINTVATFFDHYLLLFYVSVGASAWNLYLWWKSGGNDDTKRRLKKLARQFQGSRRTAPVTA